MTDICIHTCAIALNQSPCFTVFFPFFNSCFCSFSNAATAIEFVNIHRRERPPQYPTAQDLRKASAGSASNKIHLPKAISGMNVTLNIIGISHIVRENMRHHAVVINYFHIAFQIWESHVFRLGGLCIAILPKALKWVEKFAECRQWQAFHVERCVECPQQAARSGERQ